MQAFVDHIKIQESESQITTINQQKSGYQRHRLHSTMESKRTTMSVAAIFAISEEVENLKNADCDCI